MIFFSLFLKKKVSLISLLVLLRLQNIRLTAGVSQPDDSFNEVDTHGCLPAAQAGVTLLAPATVGCLVSSERGEGRKNKNNTKDSFQR